MKYATWEVEWRNNRHAQEAQTNTHATVAEAALLLNEQ